jgi:hypothetical protein
LDSRVPMETAIVPMDNASLGCAVISRAADRARSALQRWDLRRMERVELPALG